MQYKFSFYKDTDFNAISQLVLNAYQWEYPIWGLSRHEFIKGLNPTFTGHYHGQENTVGIYRANNQIVACVINEGIYDGEVFFLFDTKERGQAQELLKDMIKFARTYAAGIKDDGRTKSVTIHVPKWNTVLANLLQKSGFTEENWRQPFNVLPFTDEEFVVKLPEGYTFADGHTTPDFYLSNTHRLSFGYGATDYACEHGEQAFHELRQMHHYRKDLDLCVLDPEKRPVAMAIIWYDESMSYCELEPLAVVWWERRKGIATALLHELANRVKKLFPSCVGMLGSDQPFYSSIGYEKKDEVLRYHWELEVFISWEKESIDKYYAKEIQYGIA